MNIKALKQTRADLVAAMRGVKDKLGATDLSAEDRAKIREEFKALEAQYAANEEDLRIAEAVAEKERQWQPAQPDPDEATARAAEKRAGIAQVKDLTQDDPKKGFKSHREFLSAVMAQGQGYRMDERLKPLKQQAAAGADEQGVYSDPHGGFLVPEAFSPNVLQLQPEDDPIAGRTQNIPLASSVVNIPARVDKNHTSSVSGGLTVTRRPETVDASSSRMEFEQVVMRATSLFGLSYATEEILTDSPISFIALISNGFSQEFSSKLIDERLNGSGVGEYEGVMNSPALISVSKESGQGADTINYENVKKMRSRVWGYRNAIWLANHDCLPELMSLVQVVGTGGAPVYQPSAREDAPDLLLGRPIFYTEYTKTLGDAGDILCVNWSQYLEGTYQPLQSAESMHVRFVQHERAFKFWLRNDGRGWWRSALTPKNSSSTLSPFVRLAARA